MMSSSASYYPEQCLANEYLNDGWLFIEYFGVGFLLDSMGRKCNT